jgi:hypothetical protein
MVLDGGLCAEVQLRAKWDLSPQRLRAKNHNSEKSSGTIFEHNPEASYARYGKSLLNRKPGSLKNLPSVPYGRVP